MKTLTYNCPSCGRPVEAANELQVNRGMKCPDCQIGFIPIEIPLKREIGIRVHPANPGAWLLGIGLAIMVPSAMFIQSLAAILLGGFLSVIGAILLIKK